MKIDFSYLTANSFDLIDNNIESTIEKLICDRLKFSVYGPVPNTEVDDFFVIDQVHVLNAAFDMDTDLFAKPRDSRRDRDDQFAERFRKKLTALYILSHPRLAEMRLPRTYYIVDVHVTGQIDRSRTVTVLDVKVVREEMVPDSAGISVPDAFKKYLSPRFVEIYREMLAARNNRMKNSISLLAEKFINEYLAGECGVDPALSMERKIANVKDPELKSLLDFASRPGNSFAGCIFGREVKELTDADMDRILEFIQVFVENSIGPKRAAEVKAKTRMIVLDNAQGKDIRQ